MADYLSGVYRVAQALKGITLTTNIANASRGAVKVRCFNLIELPLNGHWWPQISRSWAAHWQDLNTLFSYPIDIKKAIYTTNAIESLNSVIRKAIKKRKLFPSDEPSEKGDSFVGAGNLLWRADLLFGSRL